MDAVKGTKPTRREQAAATRLRMLDAALEVFAESGYTGARMTDIAARAGVAVQTVYFTFHTKPEVLRECYAHAVRGPDGLAPMERPGMRRAFSARSGRSALHAFVETNLEIVARAAAIDEVAKAAQHEPEATEVRRSSEGLRRTGHTAFVRSLQERFGLRTGLDVDRGTDLLMVLAGGSTYLALRGCGWDDEQYAGWLADTLAVQLLRRPGRAPTPT